MWLPLQPLPALLYAKAAGSDVFDLSASLAFCMSHVWFNQSGNAPPAFRRVISYPGVLQPAMTCFRDTATLNQSSLTMLARLENIMMRPLHARDCYIVVLPPAVNYWCSPSAFRCFSSNNEGLLHLQRRLYQYVSNNQAVKHAREAIISTADSPISVLRQCHQYLHLPGAQFRTYHWTIVTTREGAKHPDSLKTLQDHLDSRAITSNDIVVIAEF
jgi:hypothetical protein